MLRQALNITALEHAIFVLAGLLLYVQVTRIGHQRRHPSAAMAWVLLIATLPYIGIPMFLLFGSRKVIRVRPRPHAAAPLRARHDGPDWAMQLLSAVDVPPSTRNESVVFHADGAASQHALLASIREAQSRIDLCTFILGTDEVGDALCEALMGAAHRGIRVRLMIDGVGGLKTSRRHLKALSDSDVTVRWFMPLLRNPKRGRTNLRNHRKLAVIDGQQVWSGGRNQALEYFIDQPGHPAWVDLSFVVKGPLALQAQALFEGDWHAASGKVSPSRTRMPTVHDRIEGVAAQWVPSGPDHADDTVYSLLLASAYQAKVRIMLVSPYFVPDDALLAAWCLACRRGVQLTLLIPRRSNHRLADWARERALRTLADAGATVLLHPTMVHAKAVIIDDQLALCGSVNLDGRSLFLNYELMTAFYGQAEIRWLSAWMNQQMQHAQAYMPHQPAWGRDVMEGLVRAIAFQL
ncbi:MAG: PLDc N-terminal domain-containing protein [Burkholderiales bacterium]|nr:PLDc N-terminal domain-containing protein [Burkholderiales bacterium]